MQLKRSENDPLRRHWMIVLGVALVVRLIYLVWFLRSPLHGYHFADHLYYLNWALRIAGGDWFGSEVFEQGPLYAYCLGVAFLLGLNETLVLVLQLGLGLITPLLVYEVGRRLFEQKTALLAALLTASYGPLVFYECMLMKSFLLPLLTTGLLYCGLRYRETPRPSWLMVSGIMIGLACLIRENHILYLLPMSTWVWWYAAGSGCLESDMTRPLAWQRALHLGVLVGSMGLLIVPVTLRNYGVSEEWVPVTSGGGEVLYLAHGPGANGYFHTIPFVKPSPWREHEDFRVEAARRLGKPVSRGEASSYWRGEAWSKIRQDPLRLLRLAWLKARIFLHDLEVPDSADYRLWRRYVPLMWVLPTFGWCVGLAGVGAVTCWRRLKSCQLLLGLIGVHLVSVMVTYNFGRFRIGMMPLCLLLAAEGAVWLWNRLRVEGDRSIRSWGALIMVLGITSWSFLLPPGYSVEAYEAKVPITVQGIQGQQQARETLSRLVPQLSRRPTDASLYFRLAHTYTILGYRQQALDHYRRAIQLAPGRAEFYMGYGYDLVTLGLAEKAVEPLLKGISLDPQLDMAHRLLGDHYREQGDLDAAMFHFREAVRINPQQQLLSANALAVLLLTHPDPARRNAQEAVALAGEVHRTLRAQGNPSPQVLDTLAAAYYASGQPGMAIEVIREAIPLAQRMGQVQFSEQLRVRLLQYQQSK